MLNELVVQFLVSSFYAPSTELIAQLTKAGARQVVEAEDSFPFLSAGCPVYVFSLFPLFLLLLVLMVASNVTLRLKFRSNEV